MPQIQMMLAELTSGTSTQVAFDHGLSEALLRHNVKDGREGIYQSC